MANPNNFRALGHFLGGGNHPNEIVAEAQGEQLGANTQNAITQAQERQMKIDARKGSAAAYAALPGSTPELGTYYSNALESEVDPQLGIKALGENQRNRAGEMILDPNTSAPMTERALLLRDAQAPGLQQQLGEGQVGNKLDPSGPIETPVSRSVVEKNRAEAALKNAEATTPEKYHFPPLGSGPVDPNSIRNTAHMIASGAIPAPNPGSRGYMLAGGDTLMGLVSQENPNYRGYTYTAQARSAGDLAGGIGARQGDSVNRVASHIDTTRELANELQNNSFKPGNAVSQYIAELTGKSAPTNIQEAAQILGTEIIKSMTNTGAGTGDERMGLAKHFQEAKSPKQLNDALDIASDLVRAQARSLGLRYKNAYGVDEYYQHNLLPSTRKTLHIRDDESVMENPPAVAPHTMPDVGGPGPGPATAPAAATPIAFANEAAAEKANLPDGTPITVGGVKGIWKHQ